MKRRQLSDGESDQLQRLRNENRKLKQQIGQLRKQIQRIDVDRFQNLKDILDAQDRQDRREQALEEQKELEAKWKCHDCHEGTLQLSIFERRDGVFYFRKCDNCPKRTKTKRYTEDVKGPVQSAKV